MLDDLLGIICAQMEVVVVAGREHRNGDSALGEGRGRR